MKKTILLLFCTLIFLSQTYAWTNPLTLNGEWFQYGIGDPYILKYKGTFYLYCSTKDNNTGIKCWSTKDFKTWSNAITCSTDPVTKTAYAPEVVYWNGTFYMYTSPNGGGHYVLSSNSPTGPFTPVTGNIGKVIDGSVFIDDNANWYFYHADNSGIQVCPMSGPTTFGASINTNAQMNNGWTEGPCVIKRNNNYYLLYTGNHVISKGYRIDYAKNSIGPLSAFTPQKSQNPILISSEGSFVGLGHGSAFIGPDLDSYFFCYHNLAGDYGVGPYRRLNFDRLAWNGDKMLLLGPTTWEQEAIQQPEFADYFERTEIGSNWETTGTGNWFINNQETLVQDSTNDATEIFHKTISINPTEENYTAEFTIKEEKRTNNLSRTGAVFGYTNELNYGIAVFHSLTKQLEVNFKINGEWSNARLISMPATYNFNVWHSIRIEKYGTSYKFFVDGMQKVSLTSNLGGGKVGYMTSWSKGNFGYIAYSNKVQGSGIFNTYKPVPGKIAAVHYNSGDDGIAYHDLTSENTGSKYIRNDRVDIIDCNEGGFAITDNQAGEWYKYNVNVSEKGTYNVGLRYAATSADCKIKLWQNNTDLTDIITLPPTGSMSNWRTYTIKGLNLNVGNQTLKFEIVEGNFDFYNLQFEKADNSVITKSDDFASGFSNEWNYTDGSWTVESEMAKISGFGKRTIGNTAWSDFSVQTDITYNNNMNAGLIFRVNNPALGGAGNDANQGIDFYQGYFVGIEQNSIVLGKQNYNWSQLERVAGTYNLNTKYTLKVVTNGANIKVYVNDLINPKIDFTDPEPFINGKVGIRSFNTTALFDNFSVTTTNTDNSTTIKSIYDNSDKIYVTPNPSGDKIKVNNTNNLSNISIYNIEGQLVYFTKLLQTDSQIDVSNFNKGLYLLKADFDPYQSVCKKFIKN